MRSWPNALDMIFNKIKKYADFYTLQTEDNAVLDSVEVH